MYISVFLGGEGGRLTASQQCRLFVLNVRPYQLFLFRAFSLLVSYLHRLFSVQNVLFPFGALNVQYITT